MLLFPRVATTFLLGLPLNESDQEQGFSTFCWLSPLHSAYPLIHTRAHTHTDKASSLHRRRQAKGAYKHFFSLNTPETSSLYTTVTSEY